MKIYQLLHRKKKKSSLLFFWTRCIWWGHFMRTRYIQLQTDTAIQYGKQSQRRRAPLTVTSYRLLCVSNFLSLFRASPVTHISVYGHLRTGQKRTC